MHDVISGRESLESWMNALVLEVDEESVVINLHGLGGIGKTTLLKQWFNFKDCTPLILDFGSETGGAMLSSRISQFIQRLRLFGYDFPIFDYLWTIRSVVIEEKNPASLDVFENSSFVKLLGDSAKRHLIPFHEDLRGLFNFMREQWNASKYSSKGQWLVDNLGEEWEKKWIDLLVGPSINRETWLNILHQAIVDDFNELHESDKRTLLILIDRFDEIQENVESGFWCKLFTEMKGAVSVIAGRLPINNDICTTKARTNLDRLNIDLSNCDGIQILELCALDTRGSRNLIKQMGINNEELIDIICKVGDGHPDLLRLLCDAVLKGATIQDIESVESEEMKVVRQKALNILLMKAGSQIRNFLDLVALIPYFDKSIIFRMDNNINDDYWSEILNLSFIRESLVFTEYYVMHDIVRNLLISSWKSDTAILNIKSSRIISELYESYESTKDTMFLALALSVSGNLDEEDDAIEKIQTIRRKLLDEEIYEAGLQAISYPIYGTNKLKLLQMFAQGDFNKALGKLYQSIEILRNAMNIASSDMSKDKDLLQECINAGDKNAESYTIIGNHKMALRIYENLVNYYGKFSEHFLAFWFLRIGQLQIRFERYTTAFEYLQKSQEICQRIEGADSVLAGVLDAFGAYYVQRRIGASVVDLQVLTDLESNTDLRDDLLSAEQHLCKALEQRRHVAEEQPDSRILITNIAATLYNLGRIEIFLQKYDLAMNHSNEACEIYKRFSTHSEFFSLYVDTLGQIGDIYRFQNDNDSAHKYYDVALNEVRSRTNLSSESINKQQSVLLSKLGFLYFQNQDWEKAYEIFIEAFTISVELYLLSPSHEKMTIMLFVHLVESLHKHKSCSIDEAREEIIAWVTNKLQKIDRLDILDNIAS